MKNEIENIDDKMARLKIEKSLQLEEMLKSKDPSQILKASKYIQENTSHKSFMVFPDNEMYSGQGWRMQPTRITDEVLRAMAKTPVTFSVVSTRIEQIANFTNWTDDIQKPGWTIRKKPGRFTEKGEKKELTKGEKTLIDKLAIFVEDGGFNIFTQIPEGFEKFLRKISKDTLELDKLTFEIVYGNSIVPKEYIAVDAATIYLADTEEWVGKPTKGNKIFKNGLFSTDREYKPAFTQVWRNQIHNIYYPWEMSFAMRNDTTDIMRNGYGMSELEVLMQVITWILYGQQYNGHFFQQGSNPRGFFNIKGNLNPAKLNEFKQSWRSMVTGITNVHRIPVIDGEDIDVTWNDMQQTNKDMEWGNWEDFLLAIHCAVYKIDPSEIGYNLQKAHQIFGQDGQKQRLDHSQSKGLHPVLRFIAKTITNYLIKPFTDEYEFIFTGFDTEDHAAILDMDTKKATAGFVSMEDMFQKYSGRKFNKEKDTILNSPYIQIMGMNMMGGQGSNEEVDEQTGDSSGNLYKENPFEDYELNKGEEDGNPFDLNKALLQIGLVKK